jgi:hypothetical protein
MRFHGEDGARHLTETLYAQEILCNDPETICEAGRVGGYSRDCCRRNQPSLAPPTNEPERPKSFIEMFSDMKPFKNKVP